jgi:hypothetical protein
MEVIMTNERDNDAYLAGNAAADEEMTQEKRDNYDASEHEALVHADEDEEDEVDADV